MSAHSVTHLSRLRVASHPSRLPPPAWMSLSPPGYFLLFFYLVLSSEHSFSTVLTRLFHARRIFSTSFYLHKQSTTAKAPYNGLFKLFIERKLYELWIQWEIKGNQLWTQTHARSQTNKKPSIITTQSTLILGVLNTQKFKIQFLMIN